MSRRQGQRSTRTWIGHRNELGGKQLPQLPAADGIHPLMRPSIVVRVERMAVGVASFRVPYVGSNTLLSFSNDFQSAVPLIQLI